MYNIVEIIRDCELDIKVMIKNAVYSVAKAEKLMQDVKELLKKELEQINDKEVKEKCQVSLLKFTIKQWKETVKSLRLGEPLLLLGLAITKTKTSITVQEKNSLQVAVNSTLQKQGIPKINESMSNLAESYPTTRVAHQPLDSQMEMWKRNEDNIAMVDRLKQNTDLVIVSSHANCSKRCAYWQGKVLSLSNKSGTTEDGKKIYPLKEATDVYVTTKSGRVWKNGLLGFNCRHKLIPYKPGMRQPTVSEARRQKEYAIDIKQREFERNIRHCKANAKLLEGQEAKEYRLLAKQLTIKYEKFCVSNGRAFYRSRIIL